MIRSFNLVFQSVQQLSQVIAARRLAEQSNLLVQIFSNDTETALLQALGSRLQQQLPNAAVIGSSGYGWICGPKRETRGTLISFTQFDHTRVQSHCLPLGPDHYHTGRQLAETICQPDTRALILFADALNCNADALLQGLSSKAPNILVAGALSADSWEFSRTLTLHGDQADSGQVVAAALSGEQLHCLNHHTFGWNPIGREMEITRANGNRVYTIDHQPAQQIYAKYLGKRVQKQLLSQSVDFPLMIDRGGLEVARAPMALHDDDSISFAGTFQEGEKVRLAYGDIPGIVHTAQQQFETLPHQISEALFVYSCAGRANYLGEDIRHELAPLVNRPDSCGFFAYGELYHHQNKPELLNHTMTYLLLSESHALSRQAPQPSPEGYDSCSEDLGREGLFHLIDATNADLSQVNRQLGDLVAAQTEELRRELYMDRATKLPNRQQLLNDLEVHGADAIDFLALFNIDGFRQINDFYGIDTGDQVLVAVAQRLAGALKQSCCPQHLTLYKLPSDEFALAANDQLSDEEFLNIVESLEQNVEHPPIVVGDNRFEIQLTLGIALDATPDPNLRVKSRQALMRRADLALRQARETHREKLVYQPDLPIVENLQHNIDWTHKLKRAIREERISCYFQPIYDASTSRVKKYECLVRMIEQDGSVITPFRFLDVAKKSKLYHHLTAAVLRQAHETFRGTGMDFSVNLSLMDIKHQDTLKLIRHYLADPEFARHIIFELVESESFEDYTLVQHFLHEVKTSGGRVAIDDFGSGYSSFERIASLNIDYLKVDGSLVKTIDTNPRLRAVTQSVVDFAKRLGIQTTAEFVHSESVLSEVNQLGFDFAQGFFLCEPLSPQQLQQHINLQRTKSQVDA